MSPQAAPNTAWSITGSKDLRRLLGPGRSVDAGKRQPARPSRAPGKHPKRRPYGGLFPRTRPLSLRRRPKAAPVPDAVGEVRGHGQQAPAARREISDEAEFLDAVHDLHRGGLEDEPDLRPGLAQPRQHERGPEPAKGSRQGPVSGVHALHPSRFEVGGEGLGLVDGDVGFEGDRDQVVDHVALDQAVGAPVVGEADGVELLCLRSRRPGCGR